MKLRFVLYTLISAALVTCWFFFLKSPITEKRLAVQQSIRETETTLSEHERTLKEIPSFLKTRENLELLRQELNTRLYSRDDLLQLLGDIQSKASDAGLVVTDISPTVEELLKIYDHPYDREGQAEFLNLVISCRGSYLGFGTFLSTVEGAPYFRGINSCNIAESAVQPSQLDCAVGFKTLLSASLEEQS